MLNSAHKTIKLLTNNRQTSDEQHTTEGCPMENQQTDNKWTLDRRMTDQQLMNTNQRCMNNLWKWMKDR